MAKKKVPTLEETEQLQNGETMEQAGVLPEGAEEHSGFSEDAAPGEIADAALSEGDLPGSRDETGTDQPQVAEAELPQNTEGEISQNAGTEVHQAVEAAELVMPTDGLDDWEATMPPDAPDPLDAADGSPAEPPVEVLSVDLSEPVAPPDSGGSTPEDLDSLLEDPTRVSAYPTTRDVNEVQPPTEAPTESPAPEKTDRQKFYELKFNALDRDLTPEERQEWNSIYASYRGHSALTGTIIGIDPFSVQVRNRETGMMEKQTMYCAIVVPYRVRIVIPASEMWEKDQERPDFVLQNMVGSTIDLIIIKVDREAGFAIGSRRLACRSQRYFFAHRPNLNAVGTRIKCRMLSVGPRRCLVECYGHDIGLTQRELRYTAIPDLRNAYHPGQELDCIVKLYDPEKDMLEISVKECESNPFDGAEQRHPVGARRLALIAGKYGGGVFCNLPDGTVCMCNYSYQHEDSDFMVGDHVMLVVQRFEPDKRQMYGKILTKW